MRNAKKTEFLLDLEKPDRSEQRLDKATNSELLRIANDNFLTLKNNWTEVLAIYDRQKLNR